jgi:hypothetical protein
MKKTFQIITHVMPWEVDYCLILFDTLGRAKKRTKHRYKIDIALNLSTYCINWEQSKLDKDFFAERMESYVKLLSGFDEVNLKIYDGDGNYGHLDLQKAAVKPDNDYYISITPDQLFDPSMLFYFEHATELISEKYYLITAEIPKFWDPSWDIISNSAYSDMSPYPTGYDFLTIDRYDALHIPVTKDVNLVKLNDFKFAGWLDLYSKEFYENLAPVPDHWEGYGQWDLYAMNVIYRLKQLNFPHEITQYKLENGVTTSIEYSNWNYGENRVIYKSRLSLNMIPDQRERYNNELKRCIVNQINKIYENPYGK